MNAINAGGRLLRAAGLGPVAALAVVLTVLWSGGSRAAAWNEFGLPEPAAPALTDTIVEPFFAFVLGRADGDSLGVWCGADVAAFARERGQVSRLPLAHIVTMERRRPAPGTEDRFEGARVLAEWRLTFDGALDFPLPYSVLGYHPGSLRLSSALELAELAPVDRTLTWRDRKLGEVEHAVGAVRVFVCEHGFLLLDADAVIDHLLGDLLDDSWTVGFVTARDGPKWLGLSVMLGREGRPLYGEFDFATDSIEPHGRPLAAALAAYGRPWLDPRRYALPRPWVEN